jgi:hypothetical protein
MVYMKREKNMHSTENNSLRGIYFSTGSLKGKVL